MIKTVELRKLVPGRKIVINYIYLKLAKFLIAKIFVGQDLSVADKLSGILQPGHGFQFLIFIDYTFCTNKVVCQLVSPLDLSMKNSLFQTLAEQVYK